MGVIKTSLGLARASNKTFGGLATASTKTILGADAVESSCSTLQEQFASPPGTYSTTISSTYYLTQFGSNVSGGARCKVGFYLSKAAGATGSIYARFHASSSGTPGSFLYESATALDIASGVSTTQGWVYIPIEYTLSASTEYFLGIRLANRSGSLYWRRETQPTYKTFSSSDGTSWTEQSLRVHYYQTYSS